MKVIVLGSECIVTQKYVELVKERMMKLRRYGALVVSYDPEVYQKFSVKNRCQPELCRGCNFLYPLNGEYLPALVIDGQVKLHSGYPSCSMVDRVLYEATKLVQANAE